MEILIATKNPGKVRELSGLLAGMPITLRSLNDFKNIIEPDETGSTFSENAVLKAKSYALQTGLWTVADDSGLVVEALGGAPGVFSARYAGEDANDADRIEKLLIALDKTKNAGDGGGRAAKFVCAMAIADSEGIVKYQTEGVCRGVISTEPRGANGFGYDSIFIPEGFTETFAEMADEIKQKISHRAHASQKIISYLQRFTAV